MTGITVPQPCCAACGSTDIVRGAWAAWDVIAQDWAMSSVFDATWCHACEQMTSTAWPDLPAAAPEVAV